MQAVKSASPSITNEQRKPAINDTVAPEQPNALAYRRWSGSLVHNVTLRQSDRQRIPGPSR